MKTTLFSFLIILISMALFDGIWLGLMIKRFYIPNIGPLLSNSFAVLPAVIFYLLYAIGLCVFVVSPALKNNTGYLDLLMLGLLFGLVTYGSYDLTNQVTLKNWSWTLTLVDMAWGSCLTGAVSLVSTFITRYFGNV